MGAAVDGMDAALPAAGNRTRSCGGEITFASKWAVWLRRISDKRRAYRTEPLRSPPLSCFNPAMQMIAADPFWASGTFWGAAGVITTRTVARSTWTP